MGLLLCLGTISLAVFGQGWVDFGANGREWCIPVPTQLFLRNREPVCPALKRPCTILRVMACSLLYSARSKFRKANIEKDVTEKFRDIMIKVKDKSFTDLVNIYVVCLNVGFTYVFENF